MPGEDKIGLIAGFGQFPLLFARAARQRDLKVIAVAFPGETRPELEQEVDSLTWLYLGQLGKLIKTFQNAGVTKAAMCGGVNKTRIFKDIKPDLKAWTLLTKIRHLSDDGILRILANFMEEQGIAIVPSHELVPDLLAPAGQYTRRGPTAQEEEDMELGWEAAGELGRMDIGQTVVVRKRVLVAVEALEGTDACIRRAGELVGPGSVVVKRLKPIQDRRFDLPSVGLGTVETMAQAGASCLLLEAGGALAFDRQSMIAKADELKMCIVAREVGRIIV